VGVDCTNKALLVHTREHSCNEALMFGTVGLRQSHIEDWLPRPRLNLLQRTPSVCCVEWWWCLDEIFWDVSIVKSCSRSGYIIVEIPNVVLCSNINSFDVEHSFVDHLSDTDPVVSFELQYWNCRFTECTTEVLRIMKWLVENLLCIAERASPVRELMEMDIFIYSIWSYSLHTCIDIL